MPGFCIAAFVMTCRVMGVSTIARIVPFAHVFGKHMHVFGVYVNLLFRMFSKISVSKYVPNPEFVKLLGKATLNL